MATIGDIITGARTLFPDPASVIPAPAAPTLANISGSLANVKWDVQVTVVNSWGESLPSAVASITPTTQGFSVIMPVPASGTSYNIYFYQDSTPATVYLIALAQNNWTVSVTLLSQATSGVIPIASTAYLPDTDGGFVTARMIYQWLNEALNLGSKRVGGFLDFGGAQAVSGQPYYLIDSHWHQIDHAFFDGWPLNLGTRDDIFRHSLVSGISGYLVAQRVADQISLEMYPQPNRTGASTTLASGMAVGDTTATVTAGGLASFLPFGICQIGTETVGYGGITGNQLTGLMRGLAGTVPAAWSTGAAVTEFNLRLEGRRDPETYVVGNSASALRLPVGMDALLTLYLVHKFKLAEQNWAEAKDILKTFMEGMEALEASAEPVESPTQLRGGTTDEALGISTLSRLIIP